MILGHISIVILAGGLERLLKDAGVVIVFLGWILILVAIRRYANSVRNLLSVLPSITDFTLKETVHIKRYIFGKVGYLFGLIGASLAALIFWSSVGPSEFLSGWVEEPYNGPVVFAMRYTSIPPAILGVVGWFALEFIVGNIFWMCIANILLMRKMGKRLVIDLFDMGDMTRLRALGSTAFNAILMPAAGLVFTPAAYAGVLQTISPNLWSVYLFGSACYTLFLALVFGLSVFEIHFAIERRKKEYFTRIRAELYRIHSHIWRRNDHMVSEVEERQLLWLQNAESLLSQVPSWPLGSKTTYRFIVLLMTPTLSAFLQYLVSLVLK